MDSDKIERLIELEISGDNEPERLQLRGYFDRIEEERRKRDPKVIREEISAALTLACEKSVPEDLHNRVHFCADEDLLRSRWTWQVEFEATSVYDRYQGADGSVRAPRLPGKRWAFSIDDLASWRTAHGEFGIRMLIDDVAKLLSEHVAENRP